MTSDPTTHSVVFGHGPRPALALHCTLAHSGAWRGLAAVLAEKLMITAVDMPGHGKSVDWTREGDFHDVCTDAALPFLTEPMDVIGHSFSATVALRLAIERPELVRSLTMIEPVFFAAARLDAPAETALHQQEAQPYLDALEVGDMARAARLFNRLWGDGTRWIDFRPAARAYMTGRMHYIPAQTASIFDDSAQLLRPERLSRVAMPCLLIAGGKSPAITQSINNAIAGRLSNVRSATIPDAAHMAPMTHPAEVAQLVGELLEVS